LGKPVISVEHLTKQYDLGVIGTGTLSRDLNRWWARVRNQSDPYTRIGQRDAFERIGETILALDDISFQVEQGEALGIIGRNGAGKSTLLKILSRVTAPTSGVVKVKGRIGSLLEVGTGFHPELTGRENVYLNGAILGMKKAEVTRKFDEIVDFAGVEKFIDTPVKRYSSGMYVRLAFAVAAHLDPEILIVDEVLAVGDAEFQKKCLGKMGDVAGEGRTVLFVSHNMTAIESLCEKTVWIDQGKNVAQGNTLEIVDRYLASAQAFLQPKVILSECLESHSDSDGIIESVSLTKNGQLSNVFMHGEEFSMIISLNLEKTYREKVDIGFDIQDRTNKIIFASNTSQYGRMLISPTKAKNVLTMTIPSILLSPGIYFISLFAGDGVRDYEAIKNAIGFEVRWGDTNLIRAPYPSWGPLTLPIEWEWDGEKGKTLSGVD